MKSKRAIKFRRISCQNKNQHTNDAKYAECRVLSSNDDFRDGFFYIFSVCIVVDVMRTQYTLDWRATPSLNCLMLAVLIVATMIFFHHLQFHYTIFARSLGSSYARTYVCLCCCWQYTNNRFFEWLKNLNLVSNSSIHPSTHRWAVSTRELSKSIN